MEIAKRIAIINAEIIPALPTDGIFIIRFVSFFNRQRKIITNAIHTNMKVIVVKIDVAPKSKLLQIIPVINFTLCPVIT